MVSDEANRSAPGTMRHTVSRLARFAPIAIGVVAVNVLADPAHVIRLRPDNSDGSEARLAEILASDSNAVGPTGYDELRMHRELARRLTAAPDVLILGSSRVFALRQDQFRGARVRNAAISGASMSDVLTAYWLYSGGATRSAPLVIVGLDPWMFNHLRVGATTAELADPRAARRALALPAHSLRPLLRHLNTRARAVISPKYFQRSFAALARSRGTSIGFRGTLQSDNEDLTRLADGSIRYPKAMRQRSAPAVEAAARADASADPLYGLAGFERVADENVAELEALFRNVEARGGRVTVLLMPYHPIVFRAISESPRYRAVGETETTIRRTANRHGIPVLGSYNPLIVGVTASDFYDGLHMKEESVRRVFGSGQLVARVPEGRVTARSTSMDK